MDKAGRRVCVVLVELIAIDRWWWLLCGERLGWFGFHGHCVHGGAESHPGIFRKRNIYRHHRATRNNRAVLLRRKTQALPNNIISY
jgi:hypothetical protein